MAIIKSFSVGAGDMFYIRHRGDSFTIIDCDLSDQNADEIIGELRREAASKQITRFICTHPDSDHFGGIELLDDAMPIVNFYVVKNQAVKDTDTASFTRYCQLRDSDKAFYIHKGCKRRWINQSNEERNGAGIQILWPDLNNAEFIEALRACDAGESYNNTSAVIRYGIEGGASFMWLGDLETEFMERITHDIELEKTTVVFASHHGRYSGKIPNAWLEKLDPQVIVIGEAPSRHLHYYTGYQTLTQNSAGHITMQCVDDQVHFYATNNNYSPDGFDYSWRGDFPGYFGSLKVESAYTL